MAEFDLQGEVLVAAYSLGFVARNAAESLERAAQYFRDYLDYEQQGFNREGQPVEPFAASLGLVRAIGEVASSLRSQHQRTWGVFRRASSVARAQGLTGKQGEQEMGEELRFYAKQAGADGSADPVPDLDAAFERLRRTATEADPDRACARLDDPVLGRLVAELGQEFGGDAHNFVALAHTERTADGPGRIQRDDYYLPLFGAAIRLSATTKQVLVQLDELRRLILELRVQAGQPIDPDDEDWLAGLHTFAWAEPASRAQSIEGARLVA